LFELGEQAASNVATATDVIKRAREQCSMMTRMKVTSERIT